MNTIVVRTSKKIEVIDITEMAEAALDKDEGIALLFAEHTTAALTVNEFEPALKEDLEEFYTTLVPDREWLHNRIDNNAKAHILASLLRPFLAVPVAGRRFMLGKWQKILLLEFDGPRNRRIIITIS